MKRPSIKIIIIVLFVVFCLYIALFNPFKPVRPNISLFAYDEDHDVGLEVVFNGAGFLRSIRSPSDYKGYQLVDTYTVDEDNDGYGTPRHHQVFIRYQKKEHGSISGHLWAFDPFTSFCRTSFSLSQEDKNCSIEELRRLVFKEKLGVLMKLVLGFFQNKQLSANNFLKFNKQFPLSVGVSESESLRYFDPSTDSFRINVHELARISGWFDQKGIPNMELISKAIADASNMDDTINVKERLFLSAIEIAIASVCRRTQGVLPSETTKKIRVNGEIVETEAMAGNARVIANLNQQALRTFFISKMNRQKSHGTLWIGNHPVTVVFLEFGNSTPEKALIFDIPHENIPLGFSAGERFCNVENLYNVTASQLSFDEPLASFH